MALRSPIEVAIHSALVRSVPSGQELLDLSLIDCAPSAQIGNDGHIHLVEQDAIPERFGDGAVGYMWLRSDVTALSYRLDFLLSARGWWLAIECDGHDFHDRTKQQAAYDRSRDRELLAFGINTVRFTGSEIHHAAERCAQDVFNIAARFDRSHAAAFNEERRMFQAGREAGERAARLFHPEEHW